MVDDVALLAIVVVCAIVGVILGALRARPIHFLAMTVAGLAAIVAPFYLLQEQLQTVVAAGIVGCVVCWIAYLVATATAHFVARAHEPRRAHRRIPADRPRSMGRIR